MRDFVRDSWRIAAAFAAGAFVLSLLVGLVASNPFGVAFFRALLFALLFAGLGVAMRAVVTTYLPGAAGASPPEAQAGPASAGTVDIVVPEDEELQRQAFGGVSRAAGEDAEEEPTEVLEAADEEQAAQAEAKALGELAEELGEDLEPVPEVAPAGAPAAREAPAGEDGGGSGEPVELDALPDLAELPSASGGRRRGPSARVPRAAAGDTPEDAVRNLLADQDPETLARAVRTALKKDEKG